MGKSERRGALCASPPDLGRCWSFPGVLAGGQLGALMGCQNEPRDLVATVGIRIGVGKAAH